MKGGRVTIALNGGAACPTVARGAANDGVVTGGTVTGGTAKGRTVEGGIAEDGERTKFSLFIAPSEVPNNPSFSRGDELVGSLV